MTNVTIEIGVSRLREDIYLKSFLEVKSIPDPALRASVIADEEKVDEVDRDIMVADSELRKALIKWLTSDTTASENDALDLGTKITYTFTIAPRRANRIASGLSDSIHAYLVDSALVKFYISVNKQDYAKVHSEKSQLALRDIMSILHFKIPPLV